MRFTLISDFTNGLYSFGYRLPSDSYAIFRINKQPQIPQEEPFNNESIREKRHFSVNPNRMRNQSCAVNRTKLEGIFPTCMNYTECESFGQCLVHNYPETRTLSTSKVHKPWMFSEIIEFDNDRDCTSFVQEFFVKCQRFVHSCKALKTDVNQAYPMLGCLFREYPDLMLPLFRQK